MILTVPMHQVKRNDLLCARNPDTGRLDWTRVTAVEHEYAHPVVLRLADGFKVVGDASDLISVRRLTLLQGGRR